MAKDNGIAKLPNNVIIPEELRDALAKHDWTGPRNLQDKTGFDPNRATTKELEQHQFSGFRVNAFTGNVELWCVGRMMGSRGCDKVAKDPRVLAELHEEVFQTAGTVIEVPMPAPGTPGSKNKGKGNRSNHTRRGNYRRR